MGSENVGFDCSVDSLNMAVKNVNKKSGAKEVGPVKTVGFSNPILSGPVVPALDASENYGALEGDWGVGDLPIARLDLKHAVDSRFGDVVPGHYVYSHSPEDYLPLEPPLPVIFLKVRKRYAQTVEVGEIPLVCDTKQEVAELGGTLDYGRPDLTPFAPFCDCLVVIGEGARSEWPNTPLLDTGGKKKALARYRAQKSAYKEIGSVLAGWNAYQKMAKKELEPLWAQEWNLGSKLRKLPSFSFQVPTLVHLRKITDAAELAALKELAENL
jgi:hypothetical protein